MLLCVLAALALAIAAPWLDRVASRASGALLAVAPLAIFIYFASHIGAISAGETVRQAIAWVPQIGMGVELSFYLDGLSLLFALLISGIGALIVFYAGTYLDGHPFRGRFFACLLAFQASMLGLVLADNVIALFVFWELTSITSYFLIGFDHHRAIARKNALQALLVTGGGGLALMAGLIMFALAGGSMEISEVLSNGDVIRNHAWYQPILLLVLLGAFTKSAQWPFHFWLPNAMEAPTPVSAYLHSSTMVKAGVYLLARLSPGLGGTGWWMALLTIFGGVTMVLGAYLAFRQTYLKRILAYSTVSALGILVFLLGIGGAGATGPEAVESDLALYAAKAFAVFLLAHALYKATLFLVAGSITHETGVADVTQLGGLRRVMPITCMAGILAAASMAGFPPFFGFISKELLLEATLEEPTWGTLLTAAAMLSGILFVVVSCLVAIRPFFGKRKESPQQPHEAPLAMWLGPMLLASAGLLFGLLPGLIGEPLMSPLVSAVMGADKLVPVMLINWADLHLNIALMLGLVVLGAGVALFAAHGRVSRMVEPFDALNKIGPESWYERGLSAMLRFAAVQTRVIQSGSLRTYLLLTIATTVVLVGIAVVRMGRLPIHIDLPAADAAGAWLYENLAELLVSLLILVGAVGAVRSQHRLSAVASLGVVGYGVALIFILNGAPDLAITQFIVETLTVILFVFVIYHLPRFPKISGTSQRARDLIVAGCAGALATTLVLVATSVQPHEKISDWHADMAYEVGRGRNIVNVILVDFRALDTLGEITVLAAAAIGVLALLKLKPRRGEEPEVIP